MASGFSANGMEVDSAIDDEEEDDCGSLSMVMEIRLKSSEDIRHCWETGTKRRNREWGTHCAPTSSVVSWCQVYNLIACSTASSVDTRKRWGQAPFFYIPVHLVDPSRPNEHTVLRVRSDSPSSTMQILAWSPLSCPRALLTMDSKGCGSVWTQPAQGGPNVARAVNVWHCEYKWRQDPAILVKWIAAPSPYCWPGEAKHKKSYAERFMSMEPRTPCRWPRAGFLCFCAVTVSGFLQLHWRQWPPPAIGDPWCSTQLTTLATGSGGLIGADVIVTRAGSVLVAALPVNQPATVIVMELVPPTDDERTHISPGPGSSRSKLAYYLQSWEEPANQSGQLLSSGVSEQRIGPPIQCLVLSSLSIFMIPAQPQEHIAVTAASTYGPDGVPHDGTGGGRNVDDGGSIPEQKLVAVAFDPIQAGSSLVTMTLEGKRVVKSPQPQAALSGGSEVEKGCPGFRIEKWEIEKQTVNIHKVFGGPVGSSYTPSDVPMSMVWKMQANRWVESNGGGDEWRARKGNNKGGGGGLKDCEQEVSHGGGNGAMATEVTAAGRTDNNEVSSSVEGEHSSAGFVTLEFSTTGAEFSLAIRGGEVHLFARQDLTHLGFMTIPTASLTPGAAFSPNGCCITTIWRDSHAKGLVGSLLKIAQVPFIPQEVTAAGAEGDWGGGVGVGAAVKPGSTVETLIPMWNRHLADRATWSFATDTNWWDVIISAHNCAEEGLGTLGGMTAILDEGFQALSDKEHFSLVLDRFKCSLLEGVEVQDVRALVIDMQARLLLDHVGKSLETMLVNPMFLEPNVPPNTEITPEATALYPSMSNQMHPYVDTILDLLWHFLTWLRRYGDFCRGDAAAVQQGTQRVMGQSGGAATSGQSGWNSDTATTAPLTGGGGSGTAGTGASTDTVGGGGDRGVTSTVVSGGGEVGGAIQSGPSQVPAVRLAGDRCFLRKLWSLAFFSYFLRKTYPPPTLGGARLGGSDQQRAGGGGDSKANVKEEVASARPARSGNGNAGQGYSNDEVKKMYYLLAELCKKTHNLPSSASSAQMQAGSVGVRLHYTEGHVMVSADIVGQVLNAHNAHAQMQRPRGTDAAGVLMRELELHPPIEDALRKGTGLSAAFLAEDVLAGRLLLPEKDLSMWADSGGEELDMGRAWERAEVWSRKRRFEERDAAFGMASSSTLAEYSGFLGCRRDVITAVWKSSPNVRWHRCTRCGRHTAALASANTGSGQNMFFSNGISTNEGDSMGVKEANRPAWHFARWAFGCPICGGRWIKIL